MLQLHHHHDIRYPSYTTMPLVDDYASDDDGNIITYSPPPPSPSFPPTPSEDVDMTDDDAALHDDHTSSYRDPKNRHIQLPPISGASGNGVTLPSLQDLITEACRDCEQERSRRVAWDHEHSRIHPTHLYAGGNDAALQPSMAQAPDRHHAVPLDARRHTVHGPLSVHPQYHYLYPPPHYDPRPRYASHVPTWSRPPSTGPVYDPYADPRYVTATADDRARPRPEINFSEYTLSSHPRGYPYARPEPSVDPRDASFSQHCGTSDDRHLPQPHSWRRTHVDGVSSRGRHYRAPRRTSDDASAALSSPELPLAHPRSPPPTSTSLPRRQSLSRQPYPSPHLPSVSISSRRSSSCHSRRRSSLQSKPQLPVPPSSDGHTSSAPPARPKREQSEPADLATPASLSSTDDPRPATPVDPPAHAPAPVTRPIPKPQPFSDEQITTLGDKYLLAMHPKRTQILCRWEGGCGRHVHEPLTANIVAHLQAHHGVCARERSEELVQCRWGDKCGRTLKACSIRNHILNCHEKAKTGECRLCGGLISRAETYLMHRHLTSCLNKIAREGDIEARLLAVGVQVHRDEATGEIWFSQVPGAREREDNYDELDEER
ncbi:hypothetical protein K488DRAFT_85875 [Vararia minispora EC-137]|uniref:Uncharacterized protein n=1 Tax=Vararia minispora EC-137 TaxID=1314806 RepID=A0ACB8QL39_9AGAM|nr:hypothetical protein K488DRAFT_85875 [Vararia minispora EC-137]